MKQKIIKVGNSAAVLIPKQTMKENGLKVGDEVSFQLQDAAVASEQQQKASPLTPEFKQWLDRISTHYEDTIKELAKV